MHCYCYIAPAFVSSSAQTCEIYIIVLYNIYIYIRYLFIPQIILSYTARYPQVYPRVVYILFISVCMHIITLSCTFQYSTCDDLMQIQSEGKTWRLHAYQTNGVRGSNFAQLYVWGTALMGRSVTYSTRVVPSTTRLNQYVPQKNKKITQITLM